MRMPSLIVLLFLLVFSDFGYAQFRCGSYLVDVGDNEADVLRKCGPPTTQKRFYENGGPRYYDFGETSESSADPDDQGFIDEWIYNFGDRQLKQYLRFEDGVLQEVRDLDYGN